ncbi:MAG: hypothetical protein FD174_1695 [Geobacteraceae bacterium]|nr:MAG: hypothetical protein FD174_1695 [Geobacteraceae bacterium]
MNVQEIKEIARQKGLKVGKVKKSELITTIQEAEGNYPCFDTGKADECNQVNCLWRIDCK